jgi:hypothetical protein
MGEPVSGLWSQVNVGYSGAKRWGTGIHPVHAEHGEGPPLRTWNRQPGPSTPSDQPGEVSTALTDMEQWGYTPDDIPNLELYSYWDERPNWGDDEASYRGSTDDMPSYGRQHGGTPRGTAFRALQAGVPLERETPVQIPNETVSEGWLNKEHGNILDARTSDQSQYERQTSMQQLHVSRNNTLATLRGTDDPREPIATRLTGMKVKEWSGGERHYDMLPYSQDVMYRPFMYRTAGTDDPVKMGPNEMYVSVPVQRDAPPDPYLGQTEDTLDNYGYQEGDYYG